MWEWIQVFSLFFYLFSHFKSVVSFILSIIIACNSCIEIEWVRETEEYLKIMWCDVKAIAEKHVTDSDFLLCNLVGWVLFVFVSGSWQRASNKLQLLHLVKLKGKKKKREWNGRKRLLEAITFSHQPAMPTDENATNLFSFLYDLADHRSVCCAYMATVTVFSSKYATTYRNVHIHVNVNVNVKTCCATFTLDFRFR